MANGNWNQGCPCIKKARGSGGGRKHWRFWDENNPKVKKSLVKRLELNVQAKGGSVGRAQALSGLSETALFAEEVAKFLTRIVALL